MTNRPFRLAIGQVPAIRADVEHNLGLIERQARRAADDGATVLVLPELALTGYLVDDRFSEVATTLDGQTMRKLRRIADETGVEIVAGFIEETESALFYNAGVHVAGDEILHVHRKLYLPTYRKFDERRYFGAGWDVSAYDTDYIRTAMLICGDAWHLPLAYLAAHDGADLLLILAASSREGLADTTPCEAAWRWMCSSYALTLSCFVVFANLADGDDGDYTFYGGSFIAGPDGFAIAESETDGEDQIACDLDPELLRRQRIKLPFRRDDSLAHTIELGRRILAGKVDRTPPFAGGARGGPPAAPKPR